VAVAPSPHPTGFPRRRIPAPPIANFFANPSCLPAGVEDDGDRRRALRLASGWLLPSIRRPWDPSLDHGINSLEVPVLLILGRLQARRRTRPVRRRGLHR
jgi:hypothetical protein